MTAAHGEGVLRGSAVSVPMSPKPSAMLTRGVRIAMGLISTSLHASQDTFAVSGLVMSSKLNDIGSLSRNFHAKDALQFLDLPEMILLIRQYYYYILALSIILCALAHLESEVDTMSFCVNIIP